VGALKQPKSTQLTVRTGSAANGP